jgi:hypothetical protein
MEGAQGGRYDVDPGGRVGGDVDRSAQAGPHLGHRSGAVIQAVDHVVDGLEEDLPHVGQRHAPAATGEELNAELLLERADLVGHGRLGDRQLAGRGGEAERPGDRPEQPQPVQVPLRRGAAVRIR